jgi:hypothetical protein
LNVCCPELGDAVGAGAANSRMKAVNSVTSDAEALPWPFDIFVVSSGRALYWQLGSYSRSKPYAAASGEINIL